MGHQLVLMAELVGMEDSEAVPPEADTLDIYQLDELGGEDDENLGVSDNSERRESFVGATRAAPELCATLLFLIADAQPDAAEMATHIRRPERLDGEGRLIRAISDIAAGNLHELAEADLAFEPPADTSLGGLAVDALLRALHRGISELAGELLARPTENELPSRARETFVKVKELSLDQMNGVFDEGGAAAINVFPGPLHLANLLIALSGNLIEASICRVEPPAGVDADGWWKIIRRVAKKRPYLWRNHRDAIAKGYLVPGISSAVSFPTGGGKSTLAELKIAATLLSGRQVVVLAPTLALVEQTASSLSKGFQGYSVFGDLDDEDSLATLVVLPEIIVTTPERCLMLQALQSDAFADVGLIMFDECHLLHPRDADRSRRGVDAMLCILGLNRLADSTDFLMISAMMSNASEMAGWLAELTTRDAIPLDLSWKPTRQARGCVTYPADRIRELRAFLIEEEGNSENVTVPKRVKEQLLVRPFGFFCLRQTWATKSRRDYALMPLLDKEVQLGTGQKGWYPTPNGNQVAAEIAAAAADAELKTLVFVQSTIGAEGSVKHYGKLCERRICLTEAEAEMRRRIEDEMGGADHCYLKLDEEGRVIGGATSHHAQLLKDERDLHKSLFDRRDGLSVLFATSTVAQGMNLPSDIVLIATDRRWDVTKDKMEQLEAHELLNAAGRAGRAGESGQGFVLVVPGKVVDFDDDANMISAHWMTLQGIFSQSDQCLEIDDPMTGLLDIIHEQTVLGENEEYFLARLPVGIGDDGGDTDEEARTLLRSSFAAYRKRAAGNDEWVESRIDAALSRRAERTPEQVEVWLDRLASTTGLPHYILESLSSRIDAGAFSGSTKQCVKAIFRWLADYPSYMLQVLRPTDVEGLFGKQYKELATNVAKAEHALPVIKALTRKWMAGKTLRKMEIAAGTLSEKVGTCETARHYVARVAADMAFVAGLPARIVAARAAAAGEDPDISLVLATLATCVRRGCNTPERLANAVIHGKELSRVSALELFKPVERLLGPPAGNEDFEAVTRRVRLAYDLSSFTNLTTLPPLEPL